MQEKTVLTDESDLLGQRRSKLEVLRAKGNAYPNDFKRDALAADLHTHYDQVSHDDLEKKHFTVKVAGRIMLRRLMGKASFVTIQDMSGRIQLYVRQEELGEAVYEDFKHWDMGDIIAASGELFKTKTNELSVKVTSIRLLAKSLRPLPDKFHGLADHELRYRQRYLDLIVNEESRRIFTIRSKIIDGIRQFLNERQFLEVETPMMHVIPGGAAAKPFVTQHNAMDMQLYLRIAPELYLKRLVVGGFEKVYEINRNFRNEGISTRHNPEFTMLEFYQAYADYNDLMDLTEELMRYLAQNIMGSAQITCQGQTYDFSKPFARMSLKGSITHFNPEITEAMLNDLNQVRRLASKQGITFKDSDGLGKLQTELFEKCVEQKLVAPTFITAYPTEVSPLARMNDADPFITDRFEFFVGGKEIANGFSELNDPDDQAARFKEQVKAKEAGDVEAMSYDEEYILALEYGMPPTAGEGIGIDRLTMLFTDQPSIRDVLLFPLLRPQ